MKTFKLALLGILTFILVTSCPTPVVVEEEWTTPPPAVTNTGLIISEVGTSPYTNISSWLEVYNTSAGAIQLSDYDLRTYGRLVASPYTFSGIITFDLPSLSIPAGGYAIVRGNISAHYPSGGSVVYIDDGAGRVPNWVSNGPSSGSGFVELLQAGTTIDFVRFGTDSTSPTTGAAASWYGNNEVSLPAGSAIYYGRSITRNLALFDSNTNYDWNLRAWATPGGQNDVTSDADADLDGIPDCSEVSGSTFAGLPLYSWGARTGKRDIFIHVDYMDVSGVVPAEYGVTPIEEALAKVVAAFEAQNIAVHFDVGNLYFSGTNPGRYNLDDTSHQVPFATAITMGVAASTANLYDYKNAYMDPAKKQVFHYLLMAYSQNTDGSAGSSGLGEINGNDFIASLGNWGLVSGTNELVNFQASTIMHEFGHNLGLRHGGNVDTNYMPNYYSIMNYMYQLQGLSTIGNNEGDRYYYWVGRIGVGSLTNNYNSSTFVMNYSPGGGGSISESSIYESQGLRRSGSTGIDFNNDGDATDTLSGDLNQDGSTGTLTDFNDWANINLFFVRAYSGDVAGVSTRDSLVPVAATVAEDHQEIAYETLTPDMVR